MTITAWYVLLTDGEVCGPFSECQIRNGVRQGKIDETMRVRQEQSGWIRVSKLRTLFESLDQNGYFIRDEQEAEFGPFTLQRLKALQTSHGLPNRYWVRHGREGDWQLINDRSSTERSETTVTATESAAANGYQFVEVTMDADLAPLPPVSNESEDCVAAVATVMAPSESASTNGAGKEMTIQNMLRSSRPFVPPAPVMKLRGTTWKNAITGICERFEKLILGDPLTN